MEEQEQKNSSQQPMILHADILSRTMGNCEHHSNQLPANYPPQTPISATNRSNQLRVLNDNQTSHNNNNNAIYFQIETPFSQNNSTVLYSNTFKQKKSFLFVFLFHFCV